MLCKHEDGLRQQWAGTRPPESAQDSVDICMDIVYMMSMHDLLFDWDEHNQPKCEARVPVDHIEAMLAGNPRIYPDAAHSSEETRYLAIGTVDTVRWIFVAFTY